MSDPMQEIRTSFFQECEELLEALHDGLAELETTLENGETVNVVFRAVHSIKGGAGAFALDDLVAFAHTFETCLDLVRGNKLSLGPDLIAVFFRGADVLADLVRHARDGTSPSADDVAAVAKELERYSSTSPAAGASAAPAAPAFTPMAISLDFAPVTVVPPKPEAKSFRITFAPGPGFYENGHEPLFILRALRELGEIAVTVDLDGLPTEDTYDPAHPALAWSIRLDTEQGQDAILEVFDFVQSVSRISLAEEEPATKPNPSANDKHASDISQPDPLPPPSAAPPPKRTDATAQNATVRVDLERIDRLVNMVGELVINQSMLAQSIAEAGLTGHPKIASGLDEFLQLTRDIQDGVMLIRAQPVKALFQRMSRIVRESAAAVGKSVKLTTVGETTELDKTMIERLSDPLTHMIRNAVDHGLETTEKRRAAGKPDTGQITLTAAHRSGRVVIEISDDGGGIDRAAVLRKAEEKGLIARDAALSDAEIDGLLFLPGFSTAAEISNLSGRGVGMDVVKNTISSLGGRIAISSQAGSGTTFTISLPLTLAVLDGMLVEAGGETLVVPIGTIVETLTLKEGSLNRLGNGSYVASVRDSFVPIVDLADYLGYGRPPGSYIGSIALLIAQDDGSKAALVVSSILDQRQVVIKGIEESYGRIPGVAAATILGDGRIALILDPNDLIDRALSTQFAQAG